MSETPAGARKRLGLKIITMSLYTTLKSLVDKSSQDRALMVGDPFRMPCRVRKEDCLEQGLELKEEKRKHPTPYFKKS